MAVAPPAGLAQGRGTRPEPLRVLVVDDQPLFRRGLDLALSTVDGIEVAGEAGNGREAIDAARELAPDVVLMDVRMPEMNGIDGARHIRSQVPSARILMLTVSDDEDDLYEAVKAGANGYLLKEVSVEELAEGIRAVARGHSFLSPAMAAKLLSEFTAMAERLEDRHQLPPPSLTDREAEVLRLVARGMSNREIAGELAISENTVKNHVRNILEKLHLHNRMAAVVFATRSELIDLDES